MADTTPLVAAANKRDRAHGLAVPLVATLGRDLVIPEPVMVEVDHLLRARIGSHAGRAFLDSVGAGEHTAAFLTAGLFRRAVQIDAQYADLDLGLVDTSVMAYAERHELPILTFDFPHFRATAPERGHWRLVIDEAKYADAIG